MVYGDVEFYYLVDWAIIVFYAFIFVYALAHAAVYGTEEFGRGFLWGIAAGISLSVLIEEAVKNLKEVPK